MPAKRRRKASPLLEQLRTRHLLLVPTTTDPLDIDGLVRSWFPQADLSGGSTQLPGLGVLSGPHELTMEEAVEADMPTPWVVAYDLAVTPTRRNGPMPRRPDGLHRAFPGVTPVGAELLALEFLLALARRSGGGIRAGGARDVLVPDPGQVVDMRLVCPRWIRPGDVAAILHHEGNEGSITAAVEGRPIDLEELEAHGEPGRAYEVALDMMPAGLVSVTGRLAQGPEPAVAGEDFAASPMAVYDVRWEAPDPSWRVAEQLDGIALACRERVRGPIEGVSRTMSELGGGVVMDADGFLVDPRQL